LTIPVNTQRFRRSLIKARRNTSVKQQLIASQELSRNARSYRQLFNCKRILSYSPFNGEINPEPLLNLLTADYYLPKVINFRTRKMHFFAAGQVQNLSKLGIREPMTTQSRICGNHLDAVLLPLVGFNRNGNRLGMGAGFYDRAFAFKLDTKALSRPLLIGLAHHFQECKSLVRNSWDVPLDAIITDRELIII